MKFSIFSIVFVGMLSLILPPVGVVLCTIFLVWLFVKKRRAVPSFSQKLKVSQTITPPIVPTESESGKEGTGEEFVGGAQRGTRSNGKFIQFLILPIGNFIKGKVLHFMKRKEVRVMKKEDKRDVFGVSGMMNEGAYRKKEYLGGRPMISDTVTLPQKEEEKDQYEQLLIERIALNPQDVEAYERLGDYYMENENLEDAKECFKQVLRLSPLSRRARFRMRRIEKSLSRRK